MGVSCVHDFSYWDKDLGQTDLPDTPNMFLKSAENILDAFEKKKASVRNTMFFQNIPTSILSFLPQFFS